MGLAEQNVRPDRAPGKKPTNVSVNAELLAEARALNLNLSATLEAALESKVKAERDAKWKRDNADAIQRRNAWVEEHGLFSDEHRAF